LTRNLASAFDPLGTLGLGLVYGMTYVRSALLMIAAPIVILLLWAHLARSSWPNSDWPVLIIAAVVGLAGVVSLPWREEVKAITGVVYVLLACPALPYVGLLAVCSTDDCL
jgi:hypothetical protein